MKLSVILSLLVSTLKATSTASSPSTNNILQVWNGQQYVSCLTQACQAEAQQRAIMMGRPTGPQGAVINGLPRDVSPSPCSMGQRSILADPYPTATGGSPLVGWGSMMMPNFGNFGQSPFGAPFGQSPFGQPSFGSPFGASPFGQPPFGQSPYGSPFGQPFGQPPFGQSFGQPPFGQPFGQPPFGQSFGQPPFGQPPFGSPYGSPYGNHYGSPYGQPSFGQQPHYGTAYPPSPYGPPPPHYGGAPSPYYGSHHQPYYPPPPPYYPSQDRDQMREWDQSRRDYDRHVRNQYFRENLSPNVGERIKSGFNRIGDAIKPVWEDVKRGARNTGDLMLHGSRTYSDDDD